MAAPTIAIVSIEKLSSEPINFLKLELEQFILDHASVLIKVDIRHMGENVLKDPMDHASLVNETFQIDIQEGEDVGNAYGFLGVITKTEVELAEGDHSYLYIYGSSRSIRLERGKRLKTYSDMSLQTIVSKVTAGADRVMVTNNPAYKEKIPFSMQYFESDYVYLKRLAVMYKIPMFFSGDSLVFGDFEEKEIAKVIYDHELKEVKLNSRILPNQRTYYYHSLEEEKSEHKDDTKLPGTFTGEAGLQSDKLNLSEPFPNLPLEAPVINDGSLQLLTEKQKQTNMTRMFYVTGKTKLYKVRIGCLLDISFHKNMVVNDSLGTLRVTRVKHIFDQNDRYSNEFEACQTKFGLVFPYEEVEMPKAQPLYAICRENVDPKGLGRIQVHFDFEKEVCDYWLRCMTPDAGYSEPLGKKKNRGMIFLPEKMDRVLVNFIEGNPDKPFVMGSLFHGKNGENIGGGAGNHIKSISDKSGGKLIFNTNQEGEWGIKILDNNGNLISLDTKGKNISITAPNTITINATDIKLNATNSIQFNSEPGKSKGEGFIKMVADKTISSTALKEGITIEAKESDITMKSKTDFSISSEEANIKLQAAKETKVDGDKVKIGAASTIRISSSDTDII